MPSETPVDLNELISEIDCTPYGPAERELIERAITVADEAGEEETAYRVRMRLVQSSSMTGDTEALLAAFAWCVGRNAADPARFPNEVDDYDLLWFHKWIADSLGSNPMFPQATIAESIERMETAYRQAGVGLSGVVQTRFSEAFLAGRFGEARRYLDELARTPRDDYSHCDACVRSEEATFRILTGEPATGLDLIEEMLEQGYECGEEPERAISHTLVPLLEAGRFDEAERMHLRGYRLARGNADNIAMIARHLVFLSVTGNAHRAIEMLERHLGWLAHDRLNAAGHLEALTAFAVTCSAAGRAGLGDERVRGSDAAPLVPFLGPHDGRWTVDELGAACLRAADELAARFDERNGTSHRSETLAATVALVDRGWDLPIGRAHVVAAPAVVDPAGFVDDVTAAAFVDDVAAAGDAIARVEALQNSEEGTEDALAWLDTESAAALTPGRRTVLARLRGQVLASRGRFEEALTAVDGALELSVAHRARATTATLAALGAHIAADLGAAEDAVARMRLAKRESELAGLGSLGPAYHLGVLLVRAGHPDEAADELSRLAELEEEQGTAPGSLGHTLLWLGRARRDAGDPQGALAAWHRCRELARSCGDHVVAATAGTDLGAMLAQFEDEGALEVLDEAVADARLAEGRADLLTESLHLRGRARCGFDDDGGLADLREAAGLAEGWTRADIEDSTARALAQLGRIDEAAATGLGASDAFAAAGDEIGCGSALLVVAQALATADRHEEVLAVLADARDRVADVPQLAVRVALLEGDTFEALGRHAEAAAARARIEH
ncbi:hypothetical protein ACWF62_00730 [Rhodococcus sp. NPDC054953]